MRFMRALREGPRASQGQQPVLLNGREPHHLGWGLYSGWRRFVLFCVSAPGEDTRMGPLLCAVKFQRQMRSKIRVTLAATARISVIFIVLMDSSSAKLRIDGRDTLTFT